MTGLTPVPFDLRRSKHEDFMMGHLIQHAGWWPWRHDSRGYLISLVRRELKAGTPGVLLASTADPNAFAGVAIARPGLIVYTYVREDALGLRWRKRKLCTDMLARLGVLKASKTGVLVWTGDATRVAASSGWNIYPVDPRRRESNGIRTT